MNRPRRRKFYRRKRRYRPMTAARVKKIINSQKNAKFRDSLYTTTPSTAAAIQELTLIAQGTGGTAASDQRIDEQIKVKSISYRISMNNTGADATNIIRLIIFQWYKSNAPTTATGPLNATAGVLAHYNVDDTRGQYRVLLDKTFSISNEGEEVKIRKGFLSFKKALAVNYNSTASTSGYKGRIYAYTIGDSTAPPHPAFTANYRLKFYD